MFTHLHVPVRNTVTMTELIIFLEENKKKIGGLELEFNNTASHLSNQTLPHSNVVMYIRDLSWYVLLERQKLMARGGPGLGLAVLVRSRDIFIHGKQNISGIARREADTSVGTHCRQLAPARVPSRRSTSSSPSRQSVTVSPQNRATLS
jgi:hypothetical protein